jgi:protease-4
MAIGVIFVVSTIISMIVASTLSDEVVAPRMPDKMVLYLSLEGSFSDYSVPSPYSLSSKPNFRHIIDAIDHAQTDGRVKGLLIMPNGGALSLAQLQELRDAVKRFRATGKPTWFYAESMDEGLGSYYLASATDQIWMQPVGSLTIAGLRAEMPYARDLLDKIGIEPQFFARKEYKDVFSSFSERGMTANTRESVTKLLADVSGQMVSAIAVDRKKTADQIRAHINHGLLTDQEALASGLIDRLDYADVLKKEIRMTAAGTEDLKAMKFVRVGRYIDDMQTALAQRLPGEKAQIALIYAVGTIVSDDGATSSTASMYGEQMASAEDIVKVIDQSARDKHIKAIVLRIDSPGGSPTASETIRRSLVHAQKSGKKVVVSMGGVAASGGYWIAAPADRIFAMPTTITGSIGVAGGKFVLSGLWDKVGVNWDDVHIGDNSSLNSSNEIYTVQGRERMNAIMDSIYEAFITRVAEGRKMPKARVDQVARGRVWTGESALAIGLVDELGSLNTALDYAAVLSGMKSRRDAVIIELPKQKTTWELLAELLENQARMGQGLSAQAAMGEFLAPLLSQYGNAGYMTRESLTIQ